MRGRRLVIPNSKKLRLRGGRFWFRGENTALANGAHNLHDLGIELSVYLEGKSR
jgi:hypothetical protein